MILINEANAPLVAMSFLGKGLKLLSHAKLRLFIIIPVLINIVLYTAALSISYHYVEQAISQFIPQWLQWLNWLLLPLFFIVFLAISFFTFTILANVIAAPFYGLLSARTLALVDETAEIVEAPVLQVVWGELKRVLYIFVRMLPLAVLFIIPVVNMIAPIIWAVFGAWMLAMEFMAYPLENAGLVFTEQRELLKTVRLGMLGFGGVTMFALSLPVINILIGPAAVIGATLYIHEMQEKTLEPEKISLDKPDTSVTL